MGIEKEIKTKKIQLSITAEIEKGLRGTND